MSYIRVRKLILGFEKQSRNVFAPKVVFKNKNNGKSSPPPKKVHVFFHLVKLLTQLAVLRNELLFITASGLKIHA